MTRVLVSDSLAPQGVEVLKQADGLEVIERPGASPDELLELIPDVEGLVIRSGTKVTADVIARAEKLKVIGRAGIGVDNVDVPAATTRGFGIAEFREVGRLICTVLDGLAEKRNDNAETEARVGAEVKRLCARFPIYPNV